MAAGNHDSPPHCKIWPIDGLVADTEYPWSFATLGAGYVPPKSPVADPFGERESDSLGSVVITAVPDIADGEMPEDGAFASKTFCKSI
jgi:hypothetical protein